MCINYFCVAHIQILMMTLKFYETSTYIYILKLCIVSDQQEDN